MPIMPVLAVIGRLSAYGKAYSIQAFQNYCRMVPEYSAKIFRNRQARTAVLPEPRQGGRSCGPTQGTRKGVRHDGTQHRAIAG